MPNVVTCVCGTRLDLSERTPGHVATCPSCGREHSVEAPRPILFDDPQPGTAPVRLDRTRKRLITPDNPPKSPLMMALGSFLLVGLGQMMLGQTMKGLALLAVCIMTCGAGFLLAWPFAIVDAYLVGKKLQEGHTVGEWECF